MPGDQPSEMREIWGYCYDVNFQDMIVKKTRNLNFLSVLEAKCGYYMFGTAGPKSLTDVADVWGALK